MQITIPDTVACAVEIYCVGFVVMCFIINLAHRKDVGRDRFAYDDERSKYRMARYGACFIWPLTGLFIVSAIAIKCLDGMCGELANGFYSLCEWIKNKLSKEGDEDDES